MTAAPSAVVSDLAPTRTLRAAINLGNPVLASGTPEDPCGVTVDLARELARRLGVPATFVCVGAARESCEAVTSEAADVCFVAIEPARETELAFTAPYAVIEGVYVVRDDSPVIDPSGVDRPGTRVGVKRGSAYDLFLTRTLQYAEVVRGDEGVDIFVAQALEAGAGIRQPATEWAARHPGHRVVEQAFTQIQQAVATTRIHRAESLDHLRAFVEDVKATGFVSEALRRAGRTDATVATGARGV